MTIGQEDRDEEPVKQSLSKDGVGGSDSPDESDLDEDMIDEFAEPAEDEELADAVDEFDGDGAESEEGDIDEVVERSSKEQSARTLEIRRAIEERMAERQLHEDLDYLDLDMDE